MHWRFLHTSPAPGDWNMAVDAAISRGGFCEVPTLRIFSWQPFCISLGHHQEAADVDLAASQIAGIDVARRPTGGGAIFHAQEVTYSVSIPAGDAWYKLLPLDLYRRISEALANGLQRLGVAVVFAPGELRAAGGVNGKPSRVACFASSARNELLCRGKKLAGSAQRRFREGALQHGSILLGAHHRRLTDFLDANKSARSIERSLLSERTISLDEARGHPAEAQEVISALREGFIKTCGIQFEDGHLLPEEDELAAAWRERYQVSFSNQEASLC